MYQWPVMIGCLAENVPHIALSVLLWGNPFQFKRSGRFQIHVFPRIVIKFQLQPHRLMYLDHLWCYITIHRFLYIITFNKEIMRHVIMMISSQKIQHFFLFICTFFFATINISEYKYRISYYSSSQFSTM